MDRAPQVTLERAIARATDATVRVRVEESNTVAHGTGTIVAVHGDEALVLTCGHLFRDMLPGSQLTLDLFAGTPKQVNLVAQLIDFKANEEDIALLSVRLPVKLEPVPILPRSEAVQKGQGVFTIGCDHGNNPSRHDTKISNVNRYLGAANIEIVGAPAVGRSGGGLFDAQGRLLGVCNAACKEDNEGIYAGIEVVYQQLARIGHAHLFEGAGNVSSTTASSVGQVSLASNTTPLQSGAANAPGPATKNSTRWPDEDPRLDVDSPRQGLSLVASEPTSPASSGSLICVLRDASGQEKVLTIPRPSPALLQAIEQQGVVTR
jgi:S1-C subfamily serine protease